MRAPSTTTIWPGEFIEVNVSNELPSSDECYAIEPHYPTSTHETIHI